MKVTWDSLRRGLRLSEQETEREQRQRRRELTDVELGAEFGSLTGIEQRSMFRGPYQVLPDNGIMVRPVPVTLGERAEIIYNGLLAKSGADAVYLHYGYGPGTWRSVHTIKMSKTGDGEWRAEVPVTETGRFSFCFKDSADNWDNNYGRNWSYQIHDGSIEH